MEQKRLLIALTETRCNESTNSLYSLHGYSKLIICNRSKKGRFVALYIKDYLNYEIKKETTKTHIQALTMKKKTDKELLLVTILKRSLKFAIEGALHVNQKHMLCWRKKNCAQASVFCGDINIDLKENNISRRKFCNTLLMQVLQVRLTDSPTRGTTKSKSWIDTCFTDVACST